MSEENKDLTSAQPEKKTPDAPTPTFVRVLALLGALAVIALSIAYAYALATGGIFWF